MSIQVRSLKQALKSFWRINNKTATKALGTYSLLSSVTSMKMRGSGARMKAMTSVPHLATARDACSGTHRCAQMSLPLEVERGLWSRMATVNNISWRWQRTLTKEHKQTINIITHSGPLAGSVRTHFAHLSRWAIKGYTLSKDDTDWINFGLLQRQD